MIPVIKQIQIKQGFFPSFIYLLPNQQIAKEKYVQQIHQVLTKNKVSFKIVQQLHLSLSRTFYPAYQQIHHIVNRCKAAIKSKKIILPIILLFAKVQILQNFITLSVQKITSDRLLPIVKQIQKLTNEPYYQNPVFHVSLFKIESEISPQILEDIMAIKIQPKKSYTLKKCMMKSGISIYDLNS